MVNMYRKFSDYSSNGWHISNRLIRCIRPLNLRQINMSKQAYQHSPPPDETIEPQTSRPHEREDLVNTIRIHTIIIDLDQSVRIVEDCNTSCGSAMIYLVRRAVVSPVPVYLSEYLHSMVL